MMPVNNFADVVAQGLVSPTSKKLSVPYPTVRAIAAVSDGLAIMTAMTIGAIGYRLFVTGSTWHLDIHIAAGMAAAIIYVLIGSATGFYRISEIVASDANFGRVLRQWFLASLILTLLAFLFRIGSEFSRASIITFAIVALVLLLGSRGLIRSLVRVSLRARRIQGRRVVVLGSIDELAFISNDSLLRQFGLTEIGRIALRSETSKIENNQIDLRRSIERAMSLARERGAKAIVLAYPWHDVRGIELIRDGLRWLPLPIQLLPDTRVRQITKNISFASPSSSLVEIQRAPLSTFERAMKRTVDILGSLIGLTIFFPLMSVTAIAILVESGRPIFFRQNRTGFNAKCFSIFKFRTMYTVEGGEIIVQAKRGDSRVTRLGRILRRSSIDELPQLFNVLIGDMSLVGPRPHAIAHDNLYSALISDYAFRQHVKPGITGWAQVKGSRGETVHVDAMKQRLNWDLSYINNWSMLRDISIIFKTILEVFFSKNAY